jgi:hypothetical protein
MLVWLSKMVQGQPFCRVCRACLRIPWENHHEGRPKTDPFDSGPQNRLTISPKNLMM